MSLARSMIKFSLIALCPSEQFGYGCVFDVRNPEEDLAVAKGAFLCYFCIPLYRRRKFRSRYEELRMNWRASFNGVAEGDFQVLIQERVGRQAVEIGESISRRLTNCLRNTIMLMFSVCNEILIIYDQSPLSTPLPNKHHPPLPPLFHIYK